MGDHSVDHAAAMPGGRDAQTERQSSYPRRTLRFATFWCAVFRLLVLAFCITVLAESLRNINLPGTKGCPVPLSLP